MLHKTTGWTFLTNHAQVLYCLAHDPTMRLREVAAEVGLTERAVQRIVRELAESGYLTLERRGRRNNYRVQHQQPLRCLLARHRQVEQLLGLLAQPVADAREHPQ